jgi:hypothetical protein
LFNDIHHRYIVKIKFIINDFELFHWEIERLFN